MGETNYNTLPIILLSAKDNAAASYMISEIIDNDVTESYKAKEGDVVQDRVWRIVNKYYTADVRLCAGSDQQLPAGDHPVDAHIIYLQEDECTVSVCARRLVCGAGVRLVLSARSPGALRAWCRAQRYELAPLAPGEDGAEEEEGEGEWGAGRARAALHAHVWRGLVRTDRAPPAAVDDAADSDGESDVSGASLGSEADVERAELFAAALAALPGAAAAARDTAGDVSARPERLARAEALLSEFCRALGLDLDHC